MADRYTKSILTVIAGALFILIFQNAINPAHSGAEPLKVQICDAYNNCAGARSPLWVAVCDINGKHCADVETQTEYVRTNTGTVPLESLPGLRVYNPTPKP